MEADIQATSQKACRHRMDIRTELDRHIDLGNINHSFASLAPFSGAFTARSTIIDNIVRIGLNYRLGGV